MALTPSEVALRLNSLPSDQARALTALFDKLISDVAAVTAGEVSSDTITDATETGISLLTAVDAAAARTAIGVVDATTETAGVVLQAEAQADSTAADVAGLKTDFNALLAKLQAAGLMAS
ncbi:head fiber protein [Luteibacter yeojuensis]|uniref:head fiber protein n=1 Tax=Luteibacter yeojuensis TaxID=345309 RepID=UPI0019664172|nr:head fiber protein [Luteibacter yeojuensis]